MRVALVAPLVSAIDDGAPQLGGAQSVLADLARGLAARGHAVTLLAAPGSQVRGARVVPIEARGLLPAAFGGPRTDDGPQRDAFARVRAWLDALPDRPDVVHAHAFDAAAFEALAGLGVPVLHTLHLPPLDPAVVRAAARAGAALATVSRANAEAWQRAGVPVPHRLPNGIDVSAVPFGATAAGGLLFAGRLAPEKGADAAIRAARATGRRIRVVGDRYDAAYAERVLDPLRGDDVTFEGPRPRADVLALMAGAAAVLMPVAWDEPFGMVALEAQAAGAPVVAYARGGLLELVRDGETGVLVAPGDEAALAAGIGRAVALDRAACRANAARWSLEASLDAHEELYRRLAAAPDPEPQGPL